MDSLKTKRTHRVQWKQFLEEACSALPPLTDFPLKNSPCPAEDGLLRMVEKGLRRFHMPFEVWVTNVAFSGHDHRNEEGRLVGWTHHYLGWGRVNYGRYYRLLVRHKIYTCSEKTTRFAVQPLLECPPKLRKMAARNALLGLLGDMTTCGDTVHMLLTSPVPQRTGKKEFAKAVLSLVPKTKI